MDDFKGKVAFITGGASGIGRGIAHALARAGAKVAIADIREEALERAVTTFPKGSTVLAVKLDVTDRKAWVRAVDEVEEKLGPIDILCNNAGIALPRGPIANATYEDWDWCLGINLGGAVNGVATVVPRMIKRGAGGHIVNTASVGALVAGAGEGIYSTAKYALAGLTEELRSDLMQHKIGVSLLCPGPTQTELFASSDAVRPKGSPTGYVRPPAPGQKPGAPPPMSNITMPPDEVGEKVLRGIRRNDLFILTHPEFRHLIKARCDALLSAIPNDPIPAPRKKFGDELVKDVIYAEQIAKGSPQ